MNEEASAGKEAGQSSPACFRKATACSKIKDKVFIKNEFNGRIFFWRWLGSLSLSLKTDLFININSWYSGTDRAYHFIMNGSGKVGQFRNRNLRLSLAAKQHRLIANPGI